MVLAADVYKAGVLAGRLSLEADGATKFVYIDGYAGPAVASTLPVSDMPVVNFNGALPNFSPVYFRKAYWGVSILLS